MLAETAAPARYPVRLDVEYADHQSRWQALFRVILAIPALLLVYFLAFALESAIFVSWVIVLIRGRHPTWMFTFIVALLRVITRFYAYFFLLTDKYVVFEGEHSLTLDIDYPDRISRWKLVFWKIITSVPHLVALQFLYTAGLALSFVGWISIVFGGSYPKGLHSFATGILRWQMRVVAYALSLTDVFPPYSIDADAGPGSRRSLLISAIAGVVIIASVSGGIVAAVLAAPKNELKINVSYAELADGSAASRYVVFYKSGVSVNLIGVADPVDPFGGFIVPDEGEHFLLFELQVVNGSKHDLNILKEDFGLVDSSGGHNTPIAVVIDNHRAPRDITNRGGTATINVVFEIGAPGTPRELSFGAGAGTVAGFSEGRNRLKTIVYEFR